MERRQGRDEPAHAALVIRDEIIGRCTSATSAHPAACKATPRCVICATNLGERERERSLAFFLLIPELSIMCVGQPHSHSMSLRQESIARQVPRLLCSCKEHSLDPLQPHAVRIDKEKKNYKDSKRLVVAPCANDSRWEAVIGMVK